MTFNYRAEPHAPPDSQSQVMPIIWLGLGAAVVGLYFLLAIVLGSPMG